MKNMIRFLSHCLYRFIVGWLPLMILGFIVFTIAINCLGNYLYHQEDLANAFQESGAGQVYVCKTPEDCERVRLRNEEYSEFAGA